MRNDRSWAVFRQRQDHDEIHVAPAYKVDGLILDHHIVDVLCPCAPTLEPAANHMIIVVHNEPEMEDK